MIGSLTTFSSSSGFIAVKNSARRFSVYLFLASISMIPFAIAFEGNSTYVAVLLIMLFKNETKNMTGAEVFAYFEGDE